MQFPGPVQENTKPALPLSLSTPIDSHPCLSPLLICGPLPSVEDLLELSLGYNHMHMHVVQLACQEIWHCLNATKEKNVNMQKRSLIHR